MCTNYFLWYKRVPRAVSVEDMESWTVLILWIQSTLVISKSKGPSETLRDIRTSTYQICRIEENTYRTTKLHKWTCNLTPLVRNICWNIVEKGRNCSWGAISPLVPNICYLMLDFYIKTRIRFCLRDKRLFEIIEVEITRVDRTNIHGINSVRLSTQRIKSVSFFKDRFLS